MSRLGTDKGEQVRARQRLNLTAGEHTHEVLARVQNASRYVEQLVLERERTWRRALEQLADAGWTARELFAAADLLPVETPIERVAAHLRAHETAAGVVWKIRAQSWRARCAALERDPYLAHGLLELVRESWLGNLDVAEAIEDVADEAVGQ